MKALALALLAGALVAVGAADAGPAAKQGGNWTVFGYGADGRNAGPAKTGLTAANVSRMRREQVQLDGTVDSSPMYVRAAAFTTGVHDAFVVETSYGLVYALDAGTGAVIWQFTPGGYSSYAGTYRITTSSPAVDADRGYVYSTSPDGLVHKVDLTDGTEVRSDGWPARVTLDPAHEKLTSPVGLWRNYVTATTSSYGDAPPYQGHIVTLDRSSGRVVNVWNALCSNVHELMDPTTCMNPALTKIEFGASLWARTGAVRQPGTGNILLATANGDYDGHTLWSTSVVMLTPDGGRVLKYFTPSNWEKLSAEDQDLGSTNPALITPNLLLQGGKDGKLRLLDLRRFHSPASVGKPPVLGTALQILNAPGFGLVYTAPAVWTSNGVQWTFVATGRGLSAYVLKRDRLVRRWHKQTGGTSPVVAGGLLYVYDPDGGNLNVYAPTTGRGVASLTAGRGHWNVPIVTDGRIALGQGNANAMATSGILNIYRLPPKRAS